MLNVLYNNVSVCAMRTDGKLFSDTDCPNGCESVLYRAVQILNQNKQISLSLPTFTQEEINTLISEEENNITLDNIPTSEEIQSKIDITRGFTEQEAINKLDEYNYTILSYDGENNPVFPDPQRTLEEQKQLLRKRDPITNAISADLTEEEATNLIIASKKTEIATSNIMSKIETCVIIPSITTLIVSGTSANYVNADKTLTDNSADFTSVQEGDYLKTNGSFYKIASKTITTLTTIYPIGEDLSNISYKVVRGSFLDNFNFIKV